MNNKKIQYGIIMSIVAIMTITVMIPTNNSVLAQVSSNEHAYLEQAISKFEATQNLDKLNEKDIQKINSLKALSAKMVESSEKRGIDNEVRNIENQVSIRNEQIKTKFVEIDELERLNKLLYVVDDETKTKLRESELIVSEFYHNSSNLGTTDGKLVTFVGSDFRDKTLVIHVSPSALNTQNKSQLEFTQELTDLLTSTKLDVELDIQFKEMIPITCSSRTTTCTSFLAGISAAGDANNGLNTMGYKAKNGSTVGFVMAGHSVDGDETSVVQPYNTSTVDGTVKEFSSVSSNCDCAWVDSVPSMDNQIYKASNTAYTQNAKTSDFYQSEGSWVYKSGAKTGVTLGQIDINPAFYTQPTLMNIYGGSGDSGSPVFTLSGNNANIYGMIIESFTGSDSFQEVYYTPQDRIETVLGITTYTP